MSLIRNHNVAFEGGDSGPRETELKARHMDSVWSFDLAITRTVVGVTRLISVSPDRATSSLTTGKVSGTLTSQNITIMSNKYSKHTTLWQSSQTIWRAARAVWRNDLCFVSEHILTTIYCDTCLPIYSNSVLNCKIIVNNKTNYYKNAEIKRRYLLQCSVI